MPVLKVKNNSGSWEAVMSAASVPITTDETLTQSGVAADAKVTGDTINSLSSLIGDKSVSEQIIDNVDSTLSISGKAADAKSVGDAIAAMNYISATDDGNGVVTLGVSPLASLEGAEF